MATYTENLHLEKPAYSDAADVGALNDNMDAIDGVVGGTSMGTTATTIKGAIAEHSNKIGNSTMGTTAATLTGAIAEHESDISGLNTTVNNLNTEVGNKLPKPTNVGTEGQVLASDGNFGSHWVDPVDAEQIEDALADWLEENVPKIDNTLTHSGEAADAKVTGDVIAALRTQGINYGRCTTAGNTEAKTVTIEGITALSAGMAVVIKFVYKNTAWSPTLNINNLGAKHIYPYGYTPPPPYPIDPSYPSMIGAWENESAVLLSYDGYAFTMCGWTPREYYSGYYNEHLGSGTYPIAGISCTGYVLRDNSYLFVNFPTAASHDMSTDPKVTINVNGTGDKELKLNGETAINGVPAGTYLMFYDGTYFHVRNDGRIPGAVYIDDNATTGDTEATWSADKIATELSLKVSTNNVATQAETQAMINDCYGG